MTVTVRPAELEAYAAQLERNAGWFVSPLRDYCARHCAATDGLTGGLLAARPSVVLARDATTELLASGERNLFQVATNLRMAAASYRAGDQAAAERIWLTLPRRDAPQGYVYDWDDARHRGDFRDPFVPRPSPPAQRAEFAERIDQARYDIGVIDELLARYLHFSLGEQVFPWIAGDWDTLRENADGYAALAGPEGVQAIRANLAYGMDSLSGSWDSPAAGRFAFQIRERWLPALDALRHLLQLHKEAFEYLAQQSESTLGTLVLAVEVLKFWVVEKVLRIVQVGGLLGAARLWDEIMELLAGVLQAWHQIKTLFELLRLAFENVHEAVQLAGAEATVIEDMWLAGESRLDPLRVG